MKHRRCVFFDVAHSARTVNEFLRRHIAGTTLFPSRCKYESCYDGQFAGEESPYVFGDTLKDIFGEPYDRKDYEHVDPEIAVWDDGGEENYENYVHPFIEKAWMAFESFSQKKLDILNAVMNDAAKRRVYWMKSDAKAYGIPEDFFKSEILTYLRALVVFGRWQKNPSVVVDLSDDTLWYQQIAFTGPESDEFCTELATCYIGVRDDGTEYVDYDPKPNLDSNSNSYESLADSMDPLCARCTGDYENVDSCDDFNDDAESGESPDIRGNSDYLGSSSSDQSDLDAMSPEDVLRGVVVGLFVIVACAYFVKTHARGVYQAAIVHMKKQGGIHVQAQVDHQNSSQRNNKKHGRRKHHAGNKHKNANQRKAADRKLHSKKEKDANGDKIEEHVALQAHKEAKQSNLRAAVVKKATLTKDPEELGKLKNVKPNLDFKESMPKESPSVKSNEELTTDIKPKVATHRTAKELRQPVKLLENMMARDVDKKQRSVIQQSPSSKQSNFAVNRKQERKSVKLSSLKEKSQDKNNNEKNYTRRSIGLQRKGSALGSTVPVTSKKKKLVVSDTTVQSTEISSKKSQEKKSVQLSSGKKKAQEKSQKINGSERQRIDDAHKNGDVKNKSTGKKGITHFAASQQAEKSTRSLLESPYSKAKKVSRNANDWINTENDSQPKSRESRDIARIRTPSQSTVRVHQHDVVPSGVVSAPTHCESAGKMYKSTKAADNVVQRKPSPRTSKIHVFLPNNPTEQQKTAVPPQHSASTHSDLQIEGYSLDKLRDPSLDRTPQVKQQPSSSAHFVSNAVPQRNSGAVAPRRRDTVSDSLRAPDVHQVSTSLGGTTTSNQLHHSSGVAGFVPGGSQQSHSAHFSAHDTVSNFLGEPGSSRHVDRSFTEGGFASSVLQHSDSYPMAAHTTDNSYSLGESAVRRHYSGDTTQEIRRLSPPPGIATSTLRDSNSPPTSMSANNGNRHPHPVGEYTNTQHANYSSPTSLHASNAHHQSNSPHLTTHSADWYSTQEPEAATAVHQHQRFTKGPHTCIRPGCSERGEFECGYSCAVRYCGEDCARSDWNRHKTECVGFN